MEVLQVTGGVVMTQRKFAQDLLNEYQCYNLPPVPCPLILPSKDGAFDAPLSDPSVYKKLIGKLNYLTNTRLIFLIQYNS